MAQVTTSKIDGRVLLLVRYSVDMGPRPAHCLFTDDGERFALAVQVASGAWVSEPKYLGSTSVTGLCEDEEQHYECVLEPNAANVSALLAVGFAWERDASQLVRGHGVSPQIVAKIREDIEAAITKKQSEFLEYREKAMEAGRKRWWQFWKP